VLIQDLDTPCAVVDLNVMENNLGPVRPISTVTGLAFARTSRPTRFLSSLTFRSSLARQRRQLSEAWRG